MVPQGCELRELRKWEVTAKGYGFSFGCDENVPTLIMVLVE